MIYYVLLLSIILFVPSRLSAQKFNSPKEKCDFMREVVADAGKDDAEAHSLLGTAYFYGDYAECGIEKNYKKAFYWLKKGADSGDPASEKYLAIMYQNGLGIEQDHAEAAALYRKMHQKGDASVCGTLGGIYFRGQGVARDYAEAFRYFSEAVAFDAGDAASQHWLARIYFDGLGGVRRDRTEALKWAILSCESSKKRKGFEGFCDYKDELMKLASPSSLKEARENAASYRKNAGRGRRSGE